MSAKVWTLRLGLRAGNRLQSKVDGMRRKGGPKAPLCNFMGTWVYLCGGEPMNSSLREVFELSVSLQVLSKALERVASALAALNRVGVTPVTRDE